MSNVITFTPARRRSRAQNLRALMAGLAQGRRAQGDVYWLKENAEVLGMLTATKAAMSAGDLAPYAEFYDTLEAKLQFFPQYYRFFLSIGLDIEDLGMDGHKGKALCQWVADAGLVKAELSDLQRAEAHRLLARRGDCDPRAVEAVKGRLRRFAERESTFALPNKKAAYELTHIVFYLSDYGKRDAQLSAGILTSLHFAGVLAYLDQNHDLLAEVCTALQLTGNTPSPIWTQAVADAHALILPVSGVPEYPRQDAFHSYLVTGWAQAVQGYTSFEAQVPEGALYFESKVPQGGALRSLSQCLYDLGPKRSESWPNMRAQVMPWLDRQSQHVLEQAEASTPHFAAFFESFARANNEHVAKAG
ncbi:MAG: DUF6902 family protein [Sulfitobacter geojensis]